MFGKCINQKNILSNPKISHYIYTQFQFSSYSSFPFFVQVTFLVMTKEKESLKIPSDC